MANVSNNMGVSPFGSVATGTIEINRAVTFAGAATSAITDIVAGFSQQSAATGETVPLQSYGVAKARLGAGGATALDQLMPEASGAGDVVTAAGATAKTCAIALETGLEGETIAVFIAGPNLNGPANS